METNVKVQQNGNGIALIDKATSMINRIEHKEKDCSNCIWQNEISLWIKADKCSSYCNVDISEREPFGWDTPTIRNIKNG